MRDDSGDLRTPSERSATPWRSSPSDTPVSMPDCAKEPAEPRGLASPTTVTLVLTLLTTAWKLWQEIRAEVHH